MELVSIPSFFRCPISVEVMEDPVTLCTGVTYERKSIQKWFGEGHFTCPSTTQVLESLELTPNHTLRRLIQGWYSSNVEDICDHGISKRVAPPPNGKRIEEVLFSIRSDPTNLGSLQTLANLAKTSEGDRALIVASGGPSVLISTLYRTTNEVQIGGGEKALAILATLPLIHEAREECVTALKSSITIDTICWFLRNGNDHARLHAAQILHALLTSDENFKFVFRPAEEIFKTLALMLGDLCPLARKTALEILLIISPVRRNRIRSVEAGVVTVIIEILPEAQINMAEKTLALLEILCQCAEGRASVCEHPVGIPVLLKMIALVSNRATETASRTLWHIYKNCGTPTVLQAMVEAGTYPKLRLVLNIGCSSSTRKRTKDILNALKDRSLKVNP